MVLTYTSSLQPNAILSFAMVESVFITVLVALLFQFCRYFESHTVKPANLILWITLPWCTAILGVYWAMLGSHYATPTRLKPIVSLYSDRLSWVERLFQNAFIVNLIAIGLPAILCTSVAIPSFVANAHYSKASHMQDEWQIKYANQTTFTQEMIMEAQLIWFKLLKGTRLASIVYFFWFVWAIVCWIIYTAITIRLIMIIRSELNKSSDDFMTFIVTTAHPITNTKGIISSGQLETQDRQERRITIEEPSANANSNNKSKGDLSLKQKINSLPLLRSDMSQSVSTLAQSEQSAIQSTPSLIRTNMKKPSQIQVKPKNSTSFFKSFIPNLILTEQEENTRFTASIQESKSQQRKEMRKAFLQIFLQFLVVCPACATFAGIALYMALTIHSSFEQPSKDRLGNLFELFGPIALLSVNYAIIVFGCGASFALLQRTYEPLFSAITTTSSSSSSSYNLGILSTQYSPTNSGKKVCLTIQKVEPEIGIGQSPRSPISKKTKLPKKAKLPSHITSTFFETKSRPKQDQDGDRISLMTMSENRL